MQPPMTAPIFATCGLCWLEMNGAACTATTTRIAGVQYDRIKFGDDWPEALNPMPANCNDCGTPGGGLHHRYCDLERCPRCGGQAIACPCCD